MLNDAELQWQPNLWSSKSNARRFAHGFDHLFNQVIKLIGTDYVDVHAVRTLTQDGMARLHNLKVTTTPIDQGSERGMRFSDSILLLLFERVTQLAWPQDARGQLARQKAR